MFACAASGAGRVYIPKLFKNTRTSEARIDSCRFGWTFYAEGLAHSHAIFYDAFREARSKARCKSQCLQAHPKLRRGFQQLRQS
jgi:hypothetical protein